MDGGLMQLATLSIQASGVRIQGGTYKAAGKHVEGCHVVEVQKNATEVVLEGLVCQGYTQAAVRRDPGIRPPQVGLVGGKK